MATRYINQLSPEQKFWREVDAPPKQWHKVKTMEDMEYRNARLIPRYEPKRSF